MRRSASYFKLFRLDTIESIYQRAVEFQCIQFQKSIEHSFYEMVNKSDSSKYQQWKNQEQLIVFFFTYSFPFQ